MADQMDASQANVRWTITCHGTSECTQSPIATANSAALTRSTGSIYRAMFIFDLHFSNSGHTFRTSNQGLDGFTVSFWQQRTRNGLQVVLIQATIISRGSHGRAERSGDGAGPVRSQAGKNGPKWRATG